MMATHHSKRGNALMNMGRGKERRAEEGMDACRKPRRLTRLTIYLGLCAADRDLSLVYTIVRADGRSVCLNKIGGFLATPASMNDMVRLSRCLLLLALIYQAFHKPRCMRHG